MDHNSQLSEIEARMDAATFDVVLTGVRTGVPPAEAAASLAALFKATPDQIARLLDDRSHVVKQDCAPALAAVYKDAIEKAGGSCELVERARAALAVDATLFQPPRESYVNVSSAPRLSPMTPIPPINNIYCPKCGTEKSDGTKFCENCGAKIEILATPRSTVADGAAANEPAASATTNTSRPVALNHVIQNLRVFQNKIDRNTAYLGVLIGFAVFSFSLFLSWASIPNGMMAVDGGSTTGWHELGFLALLPLGLALYPVFLNRSVDLKNLLINIAIAFALLGYNNVINRASWHNAYGNMGSAMGAGFWIGLLSMLAISACGIAWTLHKAGDDEFKA